MYVFLSAFCYGLFFTLLLSFTIDYEDIIGVELIKN